MMQHLDRVVLIYFGDGISNRGTFHEAANLAAVWKLPVIFFCINNLYGFSVPVSKSMAIKDIADRAKGYGFPGVVVDGQNVMEVYDVTSKAVERARKGEGPTLVESKTYRYRGHYEGDPGAYRTKEEVEMWMKKRDPIDLCEKELLAKKILTKEEMRKIREKAIEEVNEAYKFAEESPLPAPESAVEDLWY
jgi:pyruvate dehydrogenase E1 component alpha subunit